MFSNNPHQCPASDRDRAHELLDSFLNDFRIAGMTPSAGQTESMQAIAEIIASKAKGNPKKRTVVFLEGLRGTGQNTLLDCIRPSLQGMNWIAAYRGTDPLELLSREPDFHGAILPADLIVALSQLPEFDTRIITHQGFTTDEILKRWDQISRDAGFSESDKTDPEIARVSSGSINVTRHILALTKSERAPHDLLSLSRKALIQILGPLLWLPTEEIIAALSRLRCIEPEQLSKIKWPKRLAVGTTVPGQVEILRCCYQGGEIVEYVYRQMIGSVFISSLSAIAPLARVLDLGAGESDNNPLVGNLAKQFSSTQFDCVDLQAQTPSTCMPSNVNWHSLDALDFVKNYTSKMDAVLLSRVLQFFPPEYTIEIARHCRRILRQRGIVLVGAFVETKSGAESAVTRCQEHPGDRPRYKYGIDVLPSLFSEAGFTTRRTVDLEIVYDGTGRRLVDVYKSGIAVALRQEDRRRFVRIWEFER